MENSNWKAIQFIDQEIQPIFKSPPLLSKRPEAPDGFVWQGRDHTVLELISAWRSFERKGRMAKNMRAANLRKAKIRGSWGVGRFYFRVKVDSERVFDLYYDRAPKDASDRSGHWVLWRELQLLEES